MKIRTTFILLCLSACVVFVTSCASLGPVYQKNDPPSGKAVIYVYRPCCGAPAVSYLLWDVTDAIATKKVEIVYDQGKDYPRIDNFSEGLKFGKKLTRIVSGSYYAYTVNPGTYYLLVENTGFGKQWGISGVDLVTRVDAKAGQRYFFYSFVRGGARPYLESRSVVKGEEEIADCKITLEEK